MAKRRISLSKRNRADHVSITEPERHSAQNCGPCALTPKTTSILFPVQASDYQNLVREPNSNGDILYESLKKLNQRFSNCGTPWVTRDAFQSYYISSVIHTSPCGGGE